MSSPSDLPLHTRFSRNTLGKDLFVGDIHGNLELFIHALKVLHFNKYRDRVFSVGDLTDRGDDSLRCLNLAREKWFFPVLGNHDSFILERFDQDPYRKSMWLMNGGEWWLSLTQAEKEAARETVASCFSLTLSVEVNQWRIGVLHAEYPFTR